MRVRTTTLSIRVAAPEFLFAGGEIGPGDGQSGPSGAAVDPTGDVSLSDFYNHRVQKFTADGGYLSQRGSPGPGPGKFSYALSLAVGPDGSVLVVDASNRVQRFTTTGTHLLQWGPHGPRTRWRPGRG